MQYDRLTPMPPNVFLIAPTLSLLLGQAAAGRVPSQVLFCSVLVCAAGALLLCLWRRRLALLLCLSTVACLYGYVAHERVLHPSFSEDHVARMPLASVPVRVEGTLYREPEQRGKRTRWFLRVDRVARAGRVAPGSGNVALTVGRAYRDWRFGDRIRLPLRLRAPKNRTGFDYVSYLARRQIYRTAYLHNDWDVELLSRKRGTFWTEVEGVRRRLRHFIYRYLSAPAAPLLEALILGDRGGISPALSKSFAEVGMAHVLSISGLHIGMLSLGTFFVVRQLLCRSAFVMLRWPVFKLAALLCAFPVLLYAALAGGRIPTTRAAIMVGVYQLAILADREDETLTSLALAALIVAAVWPGAIMEPSFQLSFLAVLAIVWGLRVTGFGRSRSDHPMVSSGRWRALAATALTSVLVPTLASLGTGPLIAFHFGYLSLAGVVANPLLVPLVGFVLVPLGLLTAITALLWSPLAVWLAWGIAPVLSFLAFAVAALAALPFSAVEVPKPEVAVVVGIYAVLVGLGLGAFFRRRKNDFGPPLEADPR